MMTKKTLLSFFKALIITLSSSWVGAAELQPDSVAEITAPITKETSTLIDFGYGQVLRIPRVLLRDPYGTTSAAGPLKREYVGLFFKFSTANGSEKKVPLEAVLDNSTGKYLIKGNEFPVKISRLFYSAGDMGYLEPRLQPFDEARPPRIALNLDCFMVESGYCYNNMRTISSDLAGIDSQYIESWIAQHPAMVNHHEQGGVYIAKPSMAYELFMNCDAYRGTPCVAYVFDKSTNFQYTLYFPPEAVSFADELIMKINGSIARWIAE